MFLIAPLQRTLKIAHSEKNCQSHLNFEIHFYQLFRSILGQPSYSVDLLLLVFVYRRPSSCVKANSSLKFSIMHL